MSIGFKRIKRTFLALIMVLSSLAINFPALADQNAKYENQEFILSTLNIIEAGRAGADEVTRGELTAMVYRVLFEQQIGYTDIKFSDVLPEHSYYNEITAMSELGIVSGYDDGTYNPDSVATYDEALSMMINALGYRIEAQEYGGFPEGYMASASKNGLLENISIAKSTDPVTFDSLVKLLYNFITSKPLVNSFSGKMSSYAKSDESLLNSKLSRCRLNIVYGVLNEVTAGREDSNGSFVIDGASYESLIETDRTLQGCSVIAFVTYDNELTAIKADGRKNNTLVISSEDLEEVTLGSIKYYNENGKLKTVKFSNALVVVKNGTVLTSVLEKDLVPCNGSVRLIDNNDDGDYEYAYVTEVEYFKVSRVSANYNVIFLDDGEYNGNGSIYINNDEQWKYCLQDSKGNRIDIDKIKKGDRISVCGSAESDYIYITLLDAPFIGAVRAYSVQDKEITVDGGSYRVALKSDGNTIIDLSQLKLNDKYYFYADGDMIVGYEKTVNSESYGFVVDAGVYDIDSIYYKILAEDKNVYKADLADDARYNGKRVKKEGFVPVKQIPIRYSVDSDGKIDSITECEEYGEKEKRRYRESTGIFTSLRYNPPLFMSDRTQIFVVPASGETLDYCANLKLSDEETYTMRAFEYDENTYSTGVIVIYSDVKYDTPGAIASEAKPVMLMSNRVVLDEDGNTVHQLTWLEGKQKKTYNVKNTDMLNSIADTMRKGDVFRYSLSSINLVDNIDLLLQPSQNQQYFHHGANTDTETVYGAVVGGKFDILPRGSTSHFVNVLDIVTDNGAKKSFLVSSDEEIYYYLFDTSRETAVSEGTFSDIMFDTAQGNVAQSKVFLYNYNNSTRAVAIVN